MYFDYSASTPMCDDAKKAYLDALASLVGNINSMHTLGEKIKKQTDANTTTILKALQTNSHNLIYTSGATEANNHILQTQLKNVKNKHVYVAPFEHESVLAPLSKLKKEGLEIRFLKVDDEGIVDLQALKDGINQETLMVIVSMVDSELGIIQPLSKIAKICQNTLLFSDITQAIGKTNITLESVDFASFSAHKFYGPKGIGGLLVNKDIKLQPLILGGQGNSGRSGTLPHELIHAMTHALKWSLDSQTQTIQSFNLQIKEALKKYCLINSTSKSVPNILNMSPINKPNLNMVQQLSNRNIYISKGSACKTNNPSSSILNLYQDSIRAQTSFRISLSRLTTQNEVDALIAALLEVLE